MNLLALSESRHMVRHSTELLTGQRRVGPGAWHLQTHVSVQQHGCVYGL